MSGSQAERWSESQVIVDPGAELVDTSMGPTSREVTITWVDALSSLLLFVFFFKIK
jgi:hypothetical protein